MASARFTEARLSDAPFVLRPSCSSLSDSARRATFEGRLGSGRAYVRVVDGISCRQMYLRSYTFSRKESVPEKAKKYIGEVRKKVFGTGFGFRMRKVRAKDDQVSCSGLFSAVRRILTCTSRIDIADEDGRRYF